MKEGQCARRSGSVAQAFRGTDEALASTSGIWVASDLVCFFS